MRAVLVSLGRGGGRLLLWFASSAIAAALMGSCVLLLLLYTPLGTSLLVTVVDVVPGLSVGAVEGRLAGPLELRGLRLEQAGDSYRIQRLRLAWRPRALFRGELRIASLTLERVLVSLAEKEETGPMRLPVVDLPFALVLEQGAIDGLAVTNAEVFRVDRLELIAALAGERLRIDRLGVEAVGTSLDVAGEVRLKADWPLDLALKWRYPVEGLEPVSGAGHLSGDLQRLDLSQRLDGLLQAGLRGQIERPLADPRFQGELRLDALGDTLARRVAPLGDLRGRVTLAGRIDAITAEGSLAGRLPEAEEVTADFHLAWGGDALTIRGLTLAAAGAGRVELSGAWRPGADGGRLDLKGQWRDLAWPPGDAALLRAPAGRLTLDGGVDDYRLTLEGELRGQELPGLRLRLVGRGDRRRLRLSDLSLETLGGRIGGGGLLAWEPTLRGRLSLALADIDPGRRWPQWPGRLAGNIEIEAEQTPVARRLGLRIANLSGTLRGYPLALKGGLRLDGERLWIEGLALRSGGSRARADGRLSTDSDLRWSLVSDDLASLYPGAAGRLALEGTLGGDLRRPRLRARIDGGGIRLRGQRLGRLAGGVELDLSRDDRFSLTLRADDLLLGDHPWSRLELRGSGGRADHRLEGELTGDAGSGLVVVTGALGGDGAWRGSLRRLELSGAVPGRWRLERPAALHWSAAGGGLERACLRQEVSRLCLSLAREAAGWRGDAALERLPLARLAPLLPEGVALAGEAEGVLAFHTDTRGALAGRLSLVLPRWRLDHQGDELVLADTRLSALLDADGASLSLRLPLGRLGAIDGEARLPRWSSLAPDRPEQPLQGRLRLRLDDLGLLGARFPQIARLSGGVDGDLRLAGTLGAPRVQGRAELAAAFDLPALGIQVRDLALTLSGDDGGVHYRGGARLGEGRLTLEGSTRLAPGWPSEVRLRGRDLLLADVPEAWLLASPDLRLTVERGAIDITGEVLVPRARLRPRSLPKGAVQPSPDVRLVGAGTSEKRGDASPLRARVRLRFGDQVSFDGFGLRGLVRGDLALSDEPGRVPSGNGQIRIEQGTYTAYGQDLEIQRGRLLFANSPLANPAVDLVARRRVAEVEVGVRVTGLLSAPELEVFSSPPMTQSDALAYLLFGRPLDRGASSADKQRLSAAASALAVGGGWLAAELGRQLGLDQLALESDSEHDLSLHMGAWLSPRLYVQYITGLTSSTNLVRLRYDLTERLQVETQAGSVQAVDLFYTIER